MLLCRFIPPVACVVKQFIDFIPLMLFFIVYKLDPRAIEFADQSFILGGIFSATAVLLCQGIYLSRHLHDDAVVEPF